MAVQNVLLLQAIAADVGQTYNASVTFDHMRQSLPDVVLLIGDISYAVGESIGA